MLGVRKYTQDYIDRCRSRVYADVSAYRELVAAARKDAACDNVRLDSATEDFKARFFNNMVLVLDHSFVHRLRTVEGKDGNPLNEVRVLSDSLMNNKGIFTADTTIKLDPSKSVLKYEVRDAIKLNEADFLLLSEAFFSEVESRYLQEGGSS
jgi:hypothetical protein